VLAVKLDHVRCIPLDAADILAAGQRDVVVADTGLGTELDLGFGTVIRVVVFDCCTGRSSPLVELHKGSVVECWRKYWVSYLPGC